MAAGPLHESITKYLGQGETARWGEFPKNVQGRPCIAARIGPLVKKRLKGTKKENVALAVLKAFEAIMQVFSKCGNVPHLSGRHVSVAH